MTWCRNTKMSASDVRNTAARKRRPYTPSAIKNDRSTPSDAGKTSRGKLPESHIKAEHSNRKVISCSLAKHQLSQHPGEGLTKKESFENCRTKKIHNSNESHKHGCQCNSRNGTSHRNVGRKSLNGSLNKKTLQNFLAETCTFDRHSPAAQNVHSNITPSPVKYSQESDTSTDGAKLGTSNGNKYEFPVSPTVSEKRSILKTCLETARRRMDLFGNEKRRTNTATIEESVKKEDIKGNVMHVSNQTLTTAIDSFQKTNSKSPPPQQVCSPTQETSTLKELLTRRIGEESSDSHFAMESRDQYPFGIYQNDKLYVFVPPSPERNDNSPSKVRQPLNLQSDQLLGTSNTLVKRIKDSSEKIPIVLVKPKKKRVSTTSCVDFVDHSPSKRRFDKSTASHLHQKTENTSNHSISHRFQPEVKQIRNKTAPFKDSTGSNSPAKHQQLLYSTTKPLTPVYSSPRATNTNSVPLKDCFINMGSRTSLPRSVVIESTNHEYKQQQLPCTKVPPTSSDGGSDGKAIMSDNKTNGRSDSNQLKSLVSDFLLEQNKRSPGPETITVMLKTEESKTVLMIPNDAVKKYNLPIQLVPKESIEQKVKSESMPTPKDTGKSDQRQGGNDTSKQKKLTKAKGTRKRTKENHSKRKSNFKKDLHCTTNPRKGTESVGGREKACPRRSEDTTPPFMESFNLKKMSDQMVTQGEDRDKLFTVASQLFYAAGAQIETRDGLIFSRRAVMTVCFTTIDPYLRTQPGVVPSSLPVFLAFGMDHMVTMIYTSHLCSGFYLVEPSGIVKHDPRRPELYVESAYLMPYSPRHQFPKNGLFLVIGVLEEDWRLSLTLANSLRQKASPDEVVEHFIGSDDCRCFSVSRQDHLSSNLRARRALSSEDLKRHKRIVNVLACRCRECNVVVRLPRRGRGKEGNSSILSSDDDSKSVAISTDAFAHINHSDTGKSIVSCNETSATVPVKNDCMIPVPDVQLCNQELYTRAAQDDSQYSGPVPPCFSDLEVLGTQADDNICFISDDDDDEEIDIVDESNDCSLRKGNCDKMVVKIGFPFKKSVNKH